MAQRRERGYVEIAMDENGPWSAEHCADARRPRPEDHTLLQDCIEAPAFQMAVGVVITANAVVIGLETDHPDYRMWPVLEDVFLIAFACELSVRLWAWGLSGFFNANSADYHWNVFDFTVVSLGAVDRTFSMMLADRSHAGQHLEVGQTRFFAMLMRSFRLMRILRIFRIFRVLKQLYLLAMGFFDAVSSVLWVAALCGLIVYICAILLTRSVGRPPASDPLAPFKQQYFGSISSSMMTLFQLMAFPDMEKFKAVYQENIGMQCFLVVFIVFGAFTMASILTGVISESMLEKSRARHEERRIERERAKTIFIRSARRVLQDHDDDGHGFLSREQFNGCKEEVMSLCDHQCMDLRAKDLDAMFDLVDYESSGTIEIEELLYGMVQLSADVRPMSVMELRRIVVRGLHGVSQRTSVLEERLQQLDVHVSEVLAAVRNTRPVGLPGTAPASAPAAAPAVSPTMVPSVTGAAAGNGVALPAPPMLPAPPAPGPGLVTGASSAS